MDTHEKTLSAWQQMMNYSIQTPCFDGIAKAWLQDFHWNVFAGAFSPRLIYMWAARHHNCTYIREQEGVEANLGSSWASDRGSRVMNPQLWLSRLLPGTKKTECWPNSQRHVRRSGFTGVCSKRVCVYKRGKPDMNKPLEPVPPFVNTLILLGSRGRTGWQMAQMYLLHHRLGLKNETQTDHCAPADYSHRIRLPNDLFCEQIVLIFLLEMLNNKCSSNNGWRSVKMMPAPARTRRPRSTY